MFHVPNQWRLREGAYGSDDSIGNAGAFHIPAKTWSGTPVFRVIASDADGWEHVSVSLPSRCPTWEEMCYIKSLFWDEDDVIIQYHPAKKDYVNCHPFCLHLWRPTDQNLPRPPKEMVGW